MRNGQMSAKSGEMVSGCRR